KVSPKVTVVPKSFCKYIIPQEIPMINKDGINPLNKLLTSSFFFDKNLDKYIIEPSFITSEGMKVIKPKSTHLLAPFSSTPKRVNNKKPVPIDKINIIRASLLSFL